ncbi:MAG: helix-turn-helix domain-containing protein [Candidatus Methylomirabilales bacterium]
MGGKSRAGRFGDRLLAVLEAKGWRKTDLIARSGLKQASVYEWLRGASEPRGDALSKLARALEVSTDYLLGSDPMTDALTPAEVVTRESLRLYLRDRGVPPGHPDYLLYQEIATSEGAPKTVKGWHDFITQVLPKISEYLRAKPRSQGGDRPRRVLPLKTPGMSQKEGKEPTS